MNKPIVVDLPQVVNITELNIERSTYLSHDQCTLMLSKSHLKVLKFSPKWKKQHAWCFFYEAYQHIEF
jgi:hypothetical protein